MHANAALSLTQNRQSPAKELLLLLAMGSGQRPEWFTSDGAMRFAPLVVAGLVKIEDGPLELVGGSGRQGAYPWPAIYHVQLTEKGEAVIAAWKAGDTAALREAQSF